MVRTLALGTIALALLLANTRTTAQVAPPTILVVVSSASANPFGRYLEEILKAEGLPAFSTVDVAGLTANQLADAKLVILAEMALTGTQAQLLLDHVNGGGRLITMRPDAQLASVLGVAPAATSQTSGYVAISQGHPSGAGLESTTLPFAGAADHYDANGGTALATLYSSLTAPTPYPAVVRFGRTATWTFDLARSVVYRRQGDPALSGVERDGTLPYRTMEPFFEAIDRERMSVPHVDVHMRLFSRTVTDLLADDLPMPRLWHFPAGARALMVVAGDADNYDPAAYDALIAKVESLGGTMTLYAARWLSYPTPSIAAAWRQRGHELGVHPIGYADGVPLAQGFATSVNFFPAAGWGSHGSTARTHDEEWVGWVGGAELAASYGLTMELSAYSWGPALGPNIGPQAKGYITGSGLPMRFVRENGTVLPVHQQLTSLIDHQLFINDGYSELTTIPSGLAFSREMIDRAVANYHTALATQFQTVYYRWGEVQGWVDGTLEYAASQGLPLWSAQRWSAFTLSRDGSRIQSATFNPATRRLSFILQVPASSEPLSLMLPASHDGNALTGVTVNGLPVGTTRQTINGRALEFFAMPATGAGAPTAFAVEAVFGSGGPDVVPPVISAVAAVATAPTAATVTWTTNEPATSRVAYGIGSPASETPADPTLRVSHAVQLTGLSAGTTYTYRVASADGAGNLATSADGTFATPSVALPSLRIADASVLEGTGGVTTLTFTVSLSAPAVAPVTVSYATVAGTATAPADFAAVSGTLTIPAGTTSAAVQVPVVADALDEANETFTVVLTAPSGATLADATGIGTIIDDDPSPSLSIGDVTVTEGTGAAGSATLTVALSAASGQTVSVAYATANGSAVAPGDFTAASGTLIFAPGETTRLIVVTIAADAAVESTETFTVVLSAPVNATIADGTAVVTILDDDVTGGGPTTLTIPVSSGAGDVNEVNGSLQTGGTFWIGNETATGSFAATRFTAVNVPRGATITAAHLEVRAATTAWTLLSFEFAADASGNSAAFAAGAGPSQRPLSLARVSHLTDQQWLTSSWYSLGDITPIIQEIVNRADWNGGNALSLVMRGTGQAWGRKFAQSFDTDPASAPRLVVTYAGGGPALPTLSINDVSITEGTGGSTTATLTVTLSTASAQTVTVTATTADGTATSPADYTGGSSTVTFAPGVTTATVAIPIVTDSLVEPNETFSVVLSAPTNATLADATGVVTIVNDDVALPTLSINDVSVTEGTGGSTTATLTVTLSTASAQTVTVTATTADGTATSPADYTGGSSTVTFAPGVTTATVAIPIVTDSLVEPNETFSVVLSAPTNATLADATGVVTIVNDDGALPTLSINDVSVTEGTGGSTTATLTVTLSAASAQTVTVTATTADGTATSPADYTGGSSTVTFAPGVTTATVAIPIVTDSLVEPNETFSVVLSAPTNATLADATGVVTIVNDDAGAGPVTVTYQIAAGADDINQDGTSLAADGAPMWVGVGATAAASYVGLRFVGVTVPRNATITSARLEVNAASTAWITLGFEFGVEAAASSAPFSAASLPSQRTLLAPRVTHSSNQQWVADTWIALDQIAPIVQSLVSRADWNPGNALGLIVRGTTGAWARKPIKSFETAAAMAPRLVITYTVP